MFDENKPSRGTLYQTFNLLSKYCMGDLPIHVHVSHVDEHAYLAAKEANFYDPNYNVAIPLREGKTYLHLGMFLVMGVL